MSKIKTEFQLQDSFEIPCGIKISIVGKKPKWNPYISLQIPLHGQAYFIKKSEMEEFAVNILKAIKSKHLRS